MRLERAQVKFNICTTAGAAACSALLTCRFNDIRSGIELTGVLVTGQQSASCAESNSSDDKTSQVSSASAQWLEHSEMHATISHTTDAESNIAVDRTMEKRGDFIAVHYTAQKIPHKSGTSQYRASVGQNRNPSPTPH